MWEDKIFAYNITQKNKIINFDPIIQKKILYTIFLFLYYIK
jgi:hypothetical protein